MSSMRTQVLLQCPLQEQMVEQKMHLAKMYLTTHLGKFERDSVAEFCAKHID